jgi:hypothetical protein
VKLATRRSAPCVARDSTPYALMLGGAPLAPAVSGSFSAPSTSAGLGASYASMRDSLWRCSMHVAPWAALRLVTSPRRGCRGGMPREACPCCGVSR